jgi:hypothetical protein
MGGQKGGFTIQQLLEAKAEEKWRQQGVPEEDIKLSRFTGMDAGDIRGFRKFTARHPGYVIITRCPNITARPHHQNFPPKPGWAEGNTNDSGFALAKRDVKTGDGSTYTVERLVISDYDLMSVWQHAGGHFEKIVVTPGEHKAGKWVPEDGAKTGPFSPTATLVIRNLNGCMESRSRIVHGCNDDWVEPHNRGVKAGDRFAVFKLGAAEFVDNLAALEGFYHELHTPWPYDGNGMHIPSKRANKQA